MTLEHKTSHKAQFFEIEIYTSSESFIQLSDDVSCPLMNLFIDVWFVMIGQVTSEGAKNLNIEKIIFKVVQMKFLAMHITNQKLSFDIFTVGNVQNIFMEHDLNILMIFDIKEKLILTHTMYCCLLLQIYLCYLWLLLCSRDTYKLKIWRKTVRTASLYLMILMFFPHNSEFTSCNICHGTYN